MIILRVLLVNTTMGSSSCPSGVTRNQYLLPNEGPQFVFS